MAYISSSLPYQHGSPAKRVLMMVPNDFMWPEFKEPLDEYGAAGLEVVVATKDGAPANPDARNFKEFKDAKVVEADLSFKEVDVKSFDAVTTVGGNGAWHDFFPNPDAHRILRESLEGDKVTALICASTGVLALLDNFEGSQQPLVAGRDVVGYYKVEAMLKELGEVNFIPGDRADPTVVVDGNLITGRNFEASESFGKAVVAALQSHQES